MFDYDYEKLRSIKSFHSIRSDLYCQQKLWLGCKLELCPSWLSDWLVPPLTPRKLCTAQIGFLFDLSFYLSTNISLIGCQWMKVFQSSKSLKHMKISMYIIVTFKDQVSSCEEIILNLNSYWTCSIYCKTRKTSVD